MTMLSSIRSFYQLIFPFFLILLCSCNSNKQTESKEIVIPVKAEKVISGNLPISKEFIGQTKGSIDAEIRARVEGIVTAIHFEEGKEVQEGQLLYTIDDSQYKTKVAQVRGQLAEAETRLAKADSDLKRIRPLVEMKAMSQRDLDSSIAQQGVAQGAVDAAKAALESANIELSYCKINSPTKGIIGLTKAKVGEFVGKGSAATVLNTVSALDPIHVRFQITEQEYLYFAKLKEKNTDSGKPEAKKVLQLVLADGSVYNEGGELASVDREIDSKTGTLAIEASFPNPKKLLRPGQFAKIQVVAENLEGVLLVPSKAVRDIQGKSQVFIINQDMTVESKLIEVGAVSGELKVVKSGIKDGDLVVTEGGQRLKTGMKVAIK